MEQMLNLQDVCSVWKSGGSSSRQHTCPSLTSAVWALQLCTAGGTSANGLPAPLAPARKRTPVPSFCGVPHGTEDAPCRTVVPRSLGCRDLAGPVVQIAQVWQ